MSFIDSLFCSQLVGWLAAALMARAASGRLAAGGGDPAAASSCCSNFSREQLRDNLTLCKHLLCLLALPLQWSSIFIEANYQCLLYLDFAFYIPKSYWKYFHRSTLQPTHVFWNEDIILCSPSYNMRQYFELLSHFSSLITAKAFLKVHAGLQAPPPLWSKVH